jgi:hypothetical protein
MPDFPALAALAARFVAWSAAQEIPARPDMQWPGAARGETPEPAAPVTAPEAVGEPEDAPDLPPGVLGYAVAVYPGGGPRCTGLTHTGLMTLESAGREAAGHAAQARNDPSSAFHSGCEYRPVEIREVGGG